MDFRVGTCSQCKAQYRVPATFTSDKAKCKSCNGVVEIGPVQSSDAKGAASKPAPAPAKPAPAVSKPAPAARGTAPAVPPAASMPSAARPVPAKAPPARPVPPAAAPKAPLAAKPAMPAPVKPAAPAKQPVQAAAARTGAKGAESVRSAAEAAAGKVRREGAKTGSSTRMRKAPKKPSPVMAGLSLVALLAIFGGVGWYFWDKNNKKLAADDAPASSVQSATEQAAATAPQEPASTEVASAPPPVAATPEAPKEPTPPPAPAPEKPLVDDIVLMDLPMQAPLDGTTPEQIEEMEGWVELVLDLDSGARGSRALKSLEERSKAAFPFVLNAMRRLDLATNDGMQNGGRLQRLLQDICHGTNFGWKFTTEPKDVIYNKKVVKKWFTNWEQARDDDAVWAKMAKLNQPKEDPPVDDPADQ